ncbi:MAG: beta-ketoacyl-[acyl-carrier-protein] synthase family protein [Verrucomicrobiae bacterium]|nr:beta-ketoacyl-[acyl-carrier-protein] synthase family protein [Verrucomicrobiae bacterium]
MHIKNQVVITGLGVVAPNGVGIDPFWKSLVEGRSGIGKITQFDASTFKCRIAGEVKDLSLKDSLPASLKVNRLARHTHLALVAFHQALESARFDPKASPHPLPIIMGVSTSALELFERGVADYLRKGPTGVSPYVVPFSSPQAVTSALADSAGVSTQTSTLSTACPSGLDAIAAGADLIRSGKADVVIAGGADSPICGYAFSGFANSRLVPFGELDPKNASRPFDARRESGVLSEAAGVVVLESLDHARARGADVYLQITGYGTHMDTVKDVPGSGLEQSMLMAIANAGCGIKDIDLICAHGPGHPVLDVNETDAIKKVFGRQSYVTPVTSIKGVVGNPLAAAGPLQVIACCLAIRHQMVPPTANYEEPDPKCDLDYVGEGARMARMGRILINSHGIAGTNSSLMVEQVGGS